MTTGTMTTTMMTTTLTIRMTWKMMTTWTTMMMPVMTIISALTMMMMMITTLNDDDDDDDNVDDILTSYDITSSLHNECGCFSRRIFAFRCFCDGCVPSNPMHCVCFRSSKGVLIFSVACKYSHFAPLKNATHPFSEIPANERGRSRLAQC